MAKSAPLSTGVVVELRWLTMTAVTPAAMTTAAAIPMSARVSGGAERDRSTFLKHGDLLWFVGVDMWTRLGGIGRGEIGEQLGAEGLAEAGSRLVIQVLEDRLERMPCHDGVSRWLRASAWRARSEQRFRGVDRTIYFGGDLVDGEVVEVLQH